ncbi:hypothetical protein WA158_000762 [Blastocystis sp. Blastoise]
MSTKIELLHICGKARVLSVGSIQTPAILFQTSGGFQPYLTLDILDKFPEKPSFYMPFGDLYPLLQALKKSNKSLSEVTCLTDNYLHVQFRDIDNFSSTKHGSKGLGFSTKDGNRDITSTDYCEYMNILRPSSFTCIPDETSINVGNRKGKQSLSNTEKWIDEAVELNKTNSVIIGNIYIVIIGNINAYKHLGLLKEHATRVSQKNIQGISVGGLYLGETIEERDSMINTILDCVPKEKLRYITGPQTPLEILECVQKGMDIFPCSLPLYLAEHGQASIFWNGENYYSNEEDDTTVLDLSNIHYHEDHSPLCKGCTCYTCKTFTRGYINHLLDVHELLGTMLLLQHNMHHYILYMKNIRNSIMNDTFESFSKQVIEHYKGN